MERRPLVIAGSGRSGTTWVLDAIARENRLRTIFEPLHPVVVKGGRSGAYRYIPDNADDMQLSSFLGNIFSGKFRSIWTDYRVRPDRLREDIKSLTTLTGTKRCFRRCEKLFRHYYRYRGTLQYPGIIVKMIRANLMLGWLHQKFGARIVLVIRHPGAVIESKMRLGGDDWDANSLLKFYLEDVRLQNDYLAPYNEFLNRELEPAAAHAAIWCIENCLPLSQAERNGYMVVFYEELLTNSENEWCRIITGLGLNKVPEEETVKQPSQQISSLSGQEGLEESHLKRWQERLDSKSLKCIDLILKEMGVDCYDTYCAYPQIKAMDLKNR